MKNLKKILSLVISLSMLMSVVAFASYDDVDYDADYAEAVELLSALDILEGDQNGNFNPDNTITRAEMAAIICRAKGLEGTAFTSGNGALFADVPSNHWAAGYISLASQSGIINGYGNGNFGPDDEVTYEQAVKMIVCALGFEPMAQSKGGWPGGYLIVANTYKITEGTNSYYGAPRKTVAQLMYNALSTPVMDQTTWGSDAEFEVLDGSRGRDYRTLLTDMGIYVATGIVGDKSYDEIGFEITEDSDDLEFEEGDSEIFLINNTDIATYKHQNVDAYVLKTKRDYKVLAVVKAVQGSSLTILSDDIDTYLSNKVEYFIDPSSSKTKTFRLSASPEIEYNMAEYQGSVSALFNTEDVELTFIENTGDKTYDTIIATKYLSARVEGVDARRDKITIDGKTITLDFEDEDTTIILEDMDGNKLDLDDFSEDDVVAVVADNSNIKNYYEYIRIIKLDNAMIRGAVDATFYSNNNSYVVIDDEEYIDASGRSLGVGDEGKFFIGMTGKIIAFDGYLSIGDYAYVLECALSTANFSDDVWVLKLLTADNGIVTYTLSDDANEYFEDIYATSIGVTGSKQLFSTLSASDKSDPDRLITYKINSKGKIRSFAPASLTGYTKEVSQDKYNDRTQIINGAPLEDNAVVFNLSNSKADNTYATDISYLVHEGKYTGFAYANEDSEYCVMVVTGGESSFNSEDGIAIVTRVMSTKDKNDNNVTQISFIQGESSGTVIFDEDSENKTGSDSAYESLSVGDIFKYNANSAGIVSEYAVIGTVDKGLLDFNEDAVEFFDEDTELLYGYIANTERRKTSRGETITICDDEKETTISVSPDSYKYTYNDAGRNIVIEAGDFMAEDAYYLDKDTGEATFAFVFIEDGFVVDIYSFNKRVNVTSDIEAVETLISQIGTVSYTSESLEKILAAESAFAALTATEKAKIANLSVLSDARETYDDLKAQDEAAKVDALIDGIGAVSNTNECKTKIEAAEAAFGALTQGEKAYVTKLDVLTTAREDYNKLVEEAAEKEKAAKAKAANVDTLISGIGKVENTNECKTKIEAAEAAFGALTQDEKAYVTKLDVLTTAKADYNKLVEAAEKEKAAKAKASNVDTLISGIGTVENTNECKTKIEAAEAAFGALTQDEKAYVTKLDVLTTARADYNKLVEDAAKAKQEPPAQEGENK